MNKVKMIIVGGFLGAGKTTLLARAAEELTRRGQKVGLITNDQAANLVDTEILQQAGREVKEVAGACFCCAFNRLLYVCDQLIGSFAPDVIIGEPVGSCTDLSATVLQPMKKLCRDIFDLSPYSVLIDPASFMQNVAGGEAGGRQATGAGKADSPGESQDESVRYIYRKQIEEADLIVLNKLDTLSSQEADGIKARVKAEFPGIPVSALSAATGAGLAQWLDTILAGGKVGQRIAQVDYDTYAAGEAALGWLNAAVRLSSAGTINWKAFGVDLLQRVQMRLTAAGADIAHVKLLLSSGGQKLKIGLTSNTGQPSLQGSIAGESRALLVVNARVRIDPGDLRAVAERCLSESSGEAITAEIVEITSFSPSRPTPLHRFDSVL